MSDAAAMKQINVRIPAELHEALAAHKQSTGEDKSDVVRRGIELALDAKPSQNGAAADGVPPAPAPEPESTSPMNGDGAAAAAESAGDHPVEPEHREGSGSGDSTSDSSTSSEEPKSEHVDLVEWLAERTDLPRALLRARIGNGRLSVAGRTWHELHIPAALLDQVELDGARL